LRRAELRIDRYAHHAARLDGAAEQVPRATAHGLEAGHARFAGGPRDDTAIGELPTAAGMERALLEHDGAGPRVDDRGLQREHVGMVVAEVARHARMITRPFPRAAGSAALCHR